jgi:hypothetical protein
VKPACASARRFGAVALRAHGELQAGDMTLIRERPELYVRRVARALDQLARPGPTLFLVTYYHERIARLSAVADDLLPRSLVLLVLASVLASAAWLDAVPPHDRWSA